MGKFDDKFVLEGEIEQLILTKNKLIKDTNDLGTEIQSQRNELRDIRIKTDNTIAKEGQRLKEINSEFISSLESKQQSLSSQEGWLFVLLAYIATQINKSLTINELLGNNFANINSLYEQLSKEIEIYKIINRHLNNKLDEITEDINSFQYIIDIQKDMNERIEEFKLIKNSIKLDSEKIEVEKESLQKKEIYIIEERKRVEIEWEKINSQWKMLENTKKHLTK